MKNLHSLFSIVLTMSLTASYIICILLIVRLFLKKMPKIFSYALWFVVLFRLLCPISFSSGLSLLNNFYSTAFVENLADTYRLPINQASQPFPAMEAENAVSVPAPVKASQLQAEAEPEITKDVSGNFDFFPYIWFWGMVLILSHSLISYIKLKKRLTTATRISENIFQSENVKTPFVCGFIHPCIYLPLHLEDKERNYVLLHEKVHIARRDYIVKLLAFFALVLHWFNPFVWISFFCMTRDMEMSCDEQVLDQLSHTDGLAFTKRDYSTSLLALAKRRTPYPHGPLLFSGHPTKNRVKNVLSYRRPSFWVMAVLGILCLFVVVSCALNPIAGEDKNTEPAGIKTEESASPSPSPLKEEETITVSYTTSPDEVSAVVPGTEGSFQENDKVIQTLIYNGIMANMSPRHPFWEFNTAAYTLLGSHELENSGEGNDTLTLYIMSSYSAYQFVNDTFCEMGGTGNLPVVITMERIIDKAADQTKFLITDYQLPTDGMKWADSIKELFPEDLWEDILSFQGVQTLNEELLNHARDYLKSIGMENTPVSLTSPVQSFPLPEEAVKLLAGLFPQYPDWNGSCSTYINRQRYTYYSSFTECQNDTYLLTYTKEDEGGAIVEYYRALLKDSQLIFIGKAPSLSGYASTQNAIQIITASEITGYIKSFSEKNPASILIDEIQQEENNNYSSTVTASYILDSNAVFVISGNEASHPNAIDFSAFQKHYQGQKKTVPYILLLADDIVISVLEGDIS